MTRHYPNLGSASDWLCGVGNLIQLIRSTTQIWVVTILGDPEAVSRERREESFQAWAEEPLGTDSHRTISKRSRECWLLLGHKNALYYSVQSANSFPRVLFVSSYTTSIILPQLPGSFPKLS